MVRRIATGTGRNSPDIKDIGGMNPTSKYVVNKPQEVFDRTSPIRSDRVGGPGKGSSHTKTTHHTRPTQMPRRGPKKGRPQTGPSQPGV